MSNMAMKYCQNEKKFTMHISKNTNHAMHLMLSVVTFGYWVLVWIIVACVNSSQHTCTSCGCKNK